MRKFKPISRLFRMNFTSNLNEINAKNYTKLMKFYIKRNDLISLSSCFSEMVNNNIHPDLITFNTIINAFVMKNDLVNSIKWFVEMDSYNVAPDKYIYNTLIHLFSNLSNVDNTLLVYNTMIQKGIQPDSVCYSFIINLFLELNDIEKADFYFNELLTNNLKPNKLIFTSFIQYHLSKQDHKTALKFINLMINSDITSKTINIKSLSNNVVGYSRLIHACILKDDIESAIGYFTAMINLNVKIDIVPINMIIQGYVKRQDIKNALLWFNKINKLNLEPSIYTYNSIIYMYGKQQDMDQVEIYHDKIIQNGLNSIVTSNTLLTINSKNIPKSLSIFEDILDSKTPDATTFQIILKTLSNSNTFKTNSIFSRLKQYKIKPTKQIFDILINNSIIHNDHKSALDYFDKLIINGFVPDTTSIWNLMRVMCDDGRYTDTILVYNKMIEVGGVPAEKARKLFIKANVMLELEDEDGQENENVNAFVDEIVNGGSLSHNI